MGELLQERLEELLQLFLKKLLQGLSEELLQEFQEEVLGELPKKKPSERNPIETCRLGFEGTPEKYCVTSGGTLSRTSAKNYLVKHLKKLS